MKSVLKRVIPIILAIGLAYTIFLYYPRNISKEINTMIYKMDDETYQVPVTITIEGKYHRRLRNDDFFEGSVIVDKFPFTEDNPFIEFDLSGSGIGMLYWWFEKGDKFDFGLDDLGMIWTDDYLEHFVIALCIHPDKLEPINSINAKTAFVIGYPSNSREEVCSLMDRLGALKKR